MIDICSDKSPKTYNNTKGASSNPSMAAAAIASGRGFHLDVGSLNDRYFSYVASFGAFTKTSYATSQSVKNALGHLAYILGGIRELSSLHRYHVALTLDDDRREEGDYIFGAVSNSTSVGGILTLDPEIVDMNDGLFELLLVKYPGNMVQLAEVIRALTSQKYDSPSIVFRPARRVRVEANPSMDWTRDGEFAKGSAEIEIENLHSAVNIMVN